MIVGYYSDMKYCVLGCKCEKGVGDNIERRYECGIIYYKDWNIN